MHHRRPTATALVAVLLPLAALLTSCGTETPTNRVYPIGAGVNDRSGDVDVLGARVVAWGDGEGRLIGSLAYNDNEADGPATLTEVAGDDLTGSVRPSGVEVSPGKGLNLADDDVTPIALQGDFKPGDVITLSLTFSTDEVSTLAVPVVKPCRQYADIIAPDFGSSSATASPSEDASASAESETDDTFLCDQPTESTGSTEGE